VGVFFWHSTCNLASVLAFAGGSQKHYGIIGEESESVRTVQPVFHDGIARGANVLETMALDH